MQTFNQVKWCPKCFQYCQGNYCSVCGTALEDKQKEVECPCCHGTGKITMPLNDTYWSALYTEQFGPKAVINYKCSEPLPNVQAYNVTLNGENSNV